MPATRGDALRLQLSGADVVMLRTAMAGGGPGGLPGVKVLAAAGRNGPGAGQLSWDGQFLRWMAPGSFTAGGGVGAPVDGVYLLEDGQDASCWIRVQAYATYLPAGSAGCRVFLDDLFPDVGGIGGADVAAADAAAGLVTVTHYHLVNASVDVATNVKLWIDAAVSGLTVSSDGATYHAPTSSGDVNVLAWSSIAAGGSVDVYVKRTVGAGAVPALAVLQELHWQWKSFV